MTDIYPWVVVSPMEQLLRFVCANPHMAATVLSLLDVLTPEEILSVVLVDAMVDDGPF
jgi:hypothetical protein